MSDFTLEYLQFSNCMSHHCTWYRDVGLSHTFDILLCILMFLTCTVIGKQAVYLGLNIVP